MYQRRTRIINFRVTEEEYQILRSASLSQGLSAYARQASLTLAEWLPKGRWNEADRPQFVLACLSELRQRVSELESKVGGSSDGSERIGETCA
jgi:hypothetical protein